MSKGWRTLVTGAAGFVGSNLVRELLRSGAQVHALVRPETNLWRVSDLIPQLTLHRVDLTKPRQVQRVVKSVQPEVVFHLAARGGHPTGPEEREEALKCSVLGTANLLEALAPGTLQRFVHIGSSLEYGPRNEPLKESDVPEPWTCRGAAKAAATLICRQIARARRQPVVVLRLFYVYGYYEQPTRLIPTAILATLRNHEVALTVPGVRHDFVFVEDVLEACLLAAQIDGVVGEIINVGSGKQWSNEEVVDMIQSISHSRIDVRTGTFPSRPSDVGYWVADISKAKKLLGWEPRHTLSRGLEKTITWFRLHQDLYDAVRPQARSSAATKEDSDFFGSSEEVRD